MSNPYRVNVNHLLRKPGSSRELHFDADLSLRTTQARVSDAVQVHVVIDAAVGLLTVTGSVEGPVTLVCNRCLREWPDVSSFPVEALYASEADNDLLEIDSEGWLDLEPALRAAVAIDLPIAPLCQPGCRGLCPTCGTDLNTAPCSGHEDEVDSPFAALQHLLDQD